jgi:chromosome segregation ATPase
MRGAKMDEVIFQGSSARRPVNVAEVSLHFSNDEGNSSRSVPRGRHHAPPVPLG